MCMSLMHACGESSCPTISFRWWGRRDFERSSAQLYSEPSTMYTLYDTLKLDTLTKYWPKKIKLDRLESYRMTIVIDLQRSRCVSGQDMY